MDPDKKELEKRYKESGRYPENRIFGKIDELDIEIAERSIIKNYDVLLDLRKQINKSMESRFRLKSTLFRLIIICLGAIFELNFEQLGQLFILDKNPELTKFLSEFTSNPSISEEELCKTKKYFEPFWSDIKDLAYKIKSDYHLFYQEYSDLKFISLLKNDKKRRPYGVALMLKGINMARWYKSEIIPYSDKYPQPILLRALFYGALILHRRSTAGLVEVLMEPVYNTPEGFVDIGYSLGFYFGIPSLKTFYRFVTSLEVDKIYQIMKENTEELIRIGCADVGMLLVDSTEIFGRRDDTDLPAINRDKSTHKMTYKIQLICDPNQIPLIAVTRLGNEIDLTGFMTVMEGLLYIKEVAEKNGKKIEYILIDAGYFDRDNLDEISNKIGAKPIFNINPRRDKHLRILKSLFEKYSKKYYDKLHDASSTIAEQTELLKEVKGLIFEPLETKCRELLQTGKEIHENVANKILNVGVENFLELYARRNVIEGLIGVGKSVYLDLTNKKNKILVIGKEKVTIKVLLILIGLQFRALTNYRILQKQNGVMKDLYWVRLSEILVNYQNISFQEID